MELLTTTTVVLLLVIFGTLALFRILFATHYKKCPSDKILVIYGKISGGLSKRCIHGGAAFVWPMIQAYQFLDLTPIPIDIKLKRAPTQDNIDLDVPSTFTVGIATERGVMENAADRLLGLTLNDIHQLAQDIIFGQMRHVIANMTFEELTTDRDKVTKNISEHVVHGLRKVGLRLININIQDVSASPGQSPGVSKADESPPAFPRETESPADQL